MKILAIFFLFFILSLAYNIAMDLITGLDFSMSWRNIKDPFGVRTNHEYIIVFFVLLCLVIPLSCSFKKRNKTSTPKNS